MLSYEEIKKVSQRITKTKYFTNKPNWEGKKFPPEKKRFEKVFNKQCNKYS